MFGLWLPHSLITSRNPIFEYDARHLWWPRTGGDLKQYTTRIVLLFCGLFGLGWLAEPLRILYYSGSQLIVLLILGFLTVGSMIIVNFYYALLTVGTINREIAFSQWDQLRLTPQGSARILVAKYAILQIRAWRVMAVDMALRGAGVTILLLFNLELLFASPGESMLSPLVLPFEASLILLSIAYVLEPLWRMRAIVSLGLAISVRIHSFTYAILGALAVILAVSIGEMLIIGGPWYFLANLSWGDDGAVVPILCCGAPMYSIGVVLMAYYFFRGIRDTALERAFKAAFNDVHFSLHVNARCRY
jgi:hypothetical protein